jgi:predicted flap endonuclease-1-like 5' DNA nuclease
MASNSLRISTATAAPASSTGTSPGDCAPVCLARPRFFCGQLLTDQDLKALIDWTEAKHRLGQGRVGPGVVHGLRVSCDPQSPTAVRVSPGYAVDPCGADIVLCNEDRLELADACPPGEGSCLILSTGSKANGVVVVDIRIHQESRDVAPVPAVGAGSCTQGTRCDFSRTEEGHCLSWCLVDAAADDPMTACLKDWEAGYYATSIQVVESFRGAFGSQRDPQAVRAWLRNQFIARAVSEPVSFSQHLNVLETITDVQLTEAFLVNSLIFLVFDARLRYLSRPLPLGGAGDGVTLARVWLQHAAPPGTWQVTHIDNHHPTRPRDPAGRWPAPPGMFNLGQLIWVPAEEALARLRAEGIAAITAQWTPPGTPSASVDALLQFLQTEQPSFLQTEQPSRSGGLFARRGSEDWTIHFLDPGYPNMPGNRVVTITRATAEAKGNRRGAQSAHPLVGGPASALGSAPPAAAVDRDTALRAAETALGSPIAVDHFPAIEGIGEQRALTLHRHGILTFKQLAEATPARLHEICPGTKDEVIAHWQEEARKRCEGGS